MAEAEIPGGPAPQAAENAPAGIYRKNALFAFFSPPKSYITAKAIRIVYATLLQNHPPFLCQTSRPGRGRRLRALGRVHAPRPGNRGQQQAQPCLDRLRRPNGPVAAVDPQRR